MFQRSYNGKELLVRAERVRASGFEHRPPVREASVIIYFLFLDYYENLYNVI